MVKPLEIQAKPMVRFNMTFKVGKYTKGMMKRILKYDNWYSFISNIMICSLQIENKKINMVNTLDIENIQYKDIEIKVSKMYNGYRGLIMWTSVNCTIDSLIESIASNIMYESPTELNPLSAFNIDLEYVWISSLQSYEYVEFDHPERIEFDSTSE